ncbi:DMT family transporter [Fulvivirga kasyanovii]|uniref:DMT family transporter n=1 Tax=Fulvivirga kasyanovii TaxID=396812 RepID=A0ABW9RSX5_9BACT|nr:DMT family transporter [Fulvivirga kasyanovii]MTI27277.1 DMT family transporter [Fulvivirga kasyanovii]
MPGKIKIHSVLLFVTLIYGANYTVAKFVMPEYLEPFGFIVFRIILGTLLFWIFSAVTGADKIKSRKDFGLLFLCGLFGVAANQLLFFKGLSLTNPINGSVIMTTSPIMVMIVAYALGKEGITVKKIIGVLIGALGAYLLLTKDGVSLSEGTFLGDLLILLNGSSYAVYLVLVKPLMAKYKAITVIKWVFLFGGIIAFPFGISELSAVDWASIPVSIWFCIAYVILAATFLVYLLNVWSLKFVNSSLVGSYIYLQPVFATLVAVAFRDDQLDVFTVLYSMVIMLGVYLVSQK